jgi:hypothetical protein
MPPFSPDNEPVRLTVASDVTGKLPPMPHTRRRKIDAVSDFERAATRLPKAMVDNVRERQRDVANKRERAQLKDGLLRLRVHGRRRKKDQ